MGTDLQVSTAFLIEANRREGQMLEAFARQGRMIRAAGDLIHSLQRERGISNLYLAARTDSHARRQEALRQTDAHLQGLRASLPDAQADAPGPEFSYRLLRKLSIALRELDALPAARERVAQFEWRSEAVLDYYGRLIQSLLQVLFETTEMLAEPALAGPLLALFNLMQCKELAGRERALGAAALGAGVDTDTGARWQSLIDGQEACLAIFETFADEDGRAQHARLLDLPFHGEFERLRRHGLSARPGPLPETPRQGERWFEVASQRMDALKALEDHLSDTLQQACTLQISRVAQATARGELPASSEAEQEQWLVVVGAPGPLAPLPSTQGLTAYPQQAIAPRIGRTLVELLHRQSQRLQQAESELHDTRRALEERKLLGKAKALLIEQRGITEAQAHRLLQHTAMNQQKSMAEVAALLLALEQSAGPATQ